MWRKKKKKERDLQLNSIPRRLRRTGQWCHASGAAEVRLAGAALTKLGQAALSFGMCAYLASPPSGIISSLRPRLAASESAHILLEGNLRPSKPKCQALRQMNRSSHQQPARALSTFHREQRFASELRFSM